MDMDHSQDTASTGHATAWTPAERNNFPRDPRRDLWFQPQFLQVLATAWSARKTLAALLRTRKTEKYLRPAAL